MDPRVRDLIAVVFDISASSVGEDAGPANIGAWDSVGHLNLIHEMERVFAVRLTLDEILGIRSARDIQELLAQRRRLPPDG